MIDTAKDSHRRASRRPARRLFRSMRSRLAIFALLVLIHSGCGSTADDRAERATADAPTSQAAGNQGAPADVVRVEVAPVSATPGAAGESIVRLTIAKSFHVNANPPTHSFLIPTEVTARAGAGDGVTFGQPVYPEAVTRKFAFDETPLRVYEGTVDVRVPFGVAPDAAPGERVVTTSVRVQPCDDSVCHPPRTIETTLRVNVVR